METVYPKGRTGGEERAITKVESLSRPGHVHYVSPDLEHCSCEAVVLCRHVRIARIRAARAEMRAARDELRAAGMRPPKRLVRAFAEARDAYHAELREAGAA